MSEPLYRLFLMKPLPTWFELSQEKQQALSAKVAESLAGVGGKIIFRGTPAWSSEQWVLFGLEKFPNAEAVQQHAAQLFELHWPYRYFETMTLLGIAWEEGMG